MNFNSDLHNFTIGAPIRKNTPLSMDEIRKAAPSAFATAAYHDRSNRYAYIPTSEIIEGMMQNGFLPYSAEPKVTHYVPAGNSWENATEQKGIQS